MENSVGAAFATERKLRFLPYIGIDKMELV